MLFTFSIEKDFFPNDHTLGEVFIKKDKLQKKNKKN